ncbi:MAG TPA: hypothetical protein VMU18_13570 [Rhodoblastus sp.]|nr:hypothetical protein [Rhodoblastus sp.]
MPRRPPSFRPFWTSLAFFVLGPACCASGALARGYGQDSSLPWIDDIVEWIGFTDFAGDRRDLFAYCLVVFAFSFGYLSDLAFKERGFGKVLNGIIGIAGICVALHFFVPHQAMLGGASEMLRFNLGLIAAGAGASVLLVIAALVKGVALRVLTRAVDNMSRPARPAPMQVEAELDPRVAAALRRKS